MYTLEELVAAFPPIFAAALKPGTAEVDWPSVPDRCKRARAYLKTTPPVVDGQGHNGHLFWAASLLLRNFAIPEAEAMEVYREYDAECDTPAKDDDLQQIFNNAMKHAQGEYGTMYGTPEQPTGSIITLTPENMVWGQRINQFWVKHKMSVNWTGVIIDGEPRAFNDANNLFITEHLDRKPGNLLMGPMSAEHERFLYERNQEMVQKLLFSPLAPSDSLPKFVAAITDQNVPETTAVLGHFIWSVKRKLTGLPVTNHIMPVLVGGQGAGKSTAINHLLKPLDKHLITASFDIFQDDRQKYLFHTYAAIFLDEMARARQADLNSLKHTITQETVSYRKLYTADSTTRPNISTFIGCSNTGVAELIIDRTGMRRFFEINTLPKLDWSAINALDYTQVWNSVNERDASPIELHKDSVAALSEQLRAVDYMDDWLARSELTPGGYPEREYKLYDAYREFLKDQSLVRSIPPYPVFTRHMKAHNFKLTGGFFGTNRPVESLVTPASAEKERN